MKGEGIVLHRVWGKSVTGGVASIARCMARLCRAWLARPSGRHLVGLCLAAIVVAGCDSGSATYRYRLTVEVETPEGLRTGSSVIQVTASKGAAFPGPEAATLQTQIRGEAVAVDLPRGQTLFALLRRPEFKDAAGSYARIAFAARLPDARSADWQEQIRVLRRLDGTAVLPERAYPMIVRFREPSNPHSIERLDPRRLSAAFGEGIRIRRIVIQITGEAVTDAIIRRLPWLGQLESFQSNRDNPFTSTLPEEVSSLRRIS